MISFKVDASGAQARMRRMEFLMSSPGLSAFLLGPARRWLVSRANARFDTEGASDGGRWLPLAPKTQRNRRALGYNPHSPINERTGELRSLMTASVGELVPFPDGASLSYPGSSEISQGPRLRFKHYGAQGANEPHQPARRVAYADQMDATVLAEAYVYFFERGMGK